MSTKQIQAFEILDHSVVHAQYFEGCGTAYTKFENVATGAGRSFKEALEDAAEQLQMQGYEIPAALVADIETADETDYVQQSFIDTGETEPEDHELWYYASIRVR